MPAEQLNAGGFGAALAIITGIERPVLPMLTIPIAAFLAAVVAMHDLTMASHFCSRMICLHRGRIDADGTPRSVLTIDRLRRVYQVEAAILPALDGGLTVTPLRAAAAEPY